MKYIIFYTAVEDNAYVLSYNVAFTKEDVPYIIQNAKDKHSAYNFLVLEVGKNVTKEFVDINK